MPYDSTHDTPDPFATPGVDSPNGTSVRSDVTGSSTSTADTAKDEAKNVATTAADAGGQVMDTAKSETSEVIAHASQSARSLFDQARGELTDQAGTQQQRVAGGLHDLADQLTQMGESTDQSGLATSLVKQASDRARSTAEWMGQREPGDLLSEAQRFAARKPGTFLVAAAALGFLGARLTRGLAAGNSAPDSASASTGSDTRWASASAPSFEHIDGRDGFDQTDVSPAPELGAGLAGREYDDTLPTVTTTSHGQPVTYTSEGRP